ncbi:MAG: hypothetical protein WCJ81_00695 [bacterium]
MNREIKKEGREKINYQRKRYQKRNGKRNKNVESIKQFYTLESTLFV